MRLLRNIFEIPLYFQPFRTGPAKKVLFIYCAQYLRTFLTNPIRRRRRFYNQPSSSRVPTHTHVYTYIAGEEGTGNGRRDDDSEHGTAGEDGYENHRGETNRNARGDRGSANAKERR